MHSRLRNDRSEEHLQKLSDMDASFVHQESPRTPMHISLVVLYDQSQRKGGKLRFKEVLEVFWRNLHKSTIFRRKLRGRSARPGHPLLGGRCGF